MIEELRSQLEAQAAARNTDEPAQLGWGFQINQLIERFDGLLNELNEIATEIRNLRNDEQLAFHFYPS